MKKRILVSAVILGALSFSMLTGFDSAATVDDVLAKYAEANKSQKNINADVDANVNVSIAVPSMKIDTALGATADLSISATTDPIGIEETGSVLINIPGDSMSADVSMYMITEADGSISMYQNLDITGVESAGWNKTSIDASQAAEMMNMVANSQFDYSKLPVSFTMASDPVTVDGTECYGLKASMTIEELLTAAETALNEVSPEAASQLSSVKSLASLLGTIKVNMEMDINSADYTVKKMRIDMDGSDWSVIEMLIPTLIGLSSGDSSETPEVDLNVISLYMEAVYDYATPVDIQLPAEAASAQTTNPQDLLSIVENAVG